jgi:hypothetical protein
VPPLDRNRLAEPASVLFGYALLAVAFILCVALCFISPLAIFLLLTVAICAILFIPLAASDLRTHWRLQHGRCPTCGYDRQGLSADAKCPECGNHE